MLRTDNACVSATKHQKLHKRSKDVSSFRTNARSLVLTCCVVPVQRIMCISRESTKSLFPINEKKLQRDEQFISVYDRFCIAGFAEYKQN